jgi:hypothetical protein
MKMIGNIVLLMLSTLLMSVIMVTEHATGLPATDSAISILHSEIVAGISESVSESNLIGGVEGIVYDQESMERLPGANVQIADLGIGTSTDANGWFELNNLPRGNHTLIVSFVGYDTREIEIEVGDRIRIAEFGIDTAFDENAEIEIMLSPSQATLEGLTITAYRRGQQRALSQQREASNIINVIDAELISTFPDPNVGESLKRIPGINIQSDQGEARYIQIRGTSPGFSSISINGEQVASPEGDDRSVTLDMIPSDLMAQISVTKAITPDMDGDAIGGAVNFTTKEAVGDARVINVTMNGGYHNNVSELSPFGGGFPQTTVNAWG